MALALAIVLSLIVAGSVLFHVLSPWWMTPIASNWGGIDGTVLLTFWLTGGGFIAIVLFVAYCVFRFRHRPGRRAAYQPENNKVEWSLAIGTTVAVAALLGPGLFVWYQYVTVPGEALPVEVMGQQWQWSYRLPGKDGRFGTTDPRFISAENPMGLNPNDPDGQDDLVITGGDLHVPLGKHVKVLLRSVDVIHDFYVPELRAKMDLVPGLESYFWFTPTKTGTYEVLCAAFCGIGHPQMRGNIVVDNESDYQEWLQKQQTFAELSGHAKNAALSQRNSPEK
ncbi:MAG: cytochrome c oxidase subunit II [Methylocapsa sp.]|nr:cytochrome c oxidase subunit II [Methylocapsa sp.]